MKTDHIQSIVRNNTSGNSKACTKNSTIPKCACAKTTLRNRLPYLFDPPAEVGAPPPRPYHGLERRSFTTQNNRFGPHRAAWLPRLSSETHAHNLGLHQNTTSKPNRVGQPSLRRHPAHHRPCIPNRLTNIRPPRRSRLAHITARVDSPEFVITATYVPLDTLGFAGLGE